MKRSHSRILLVLTLAVITVVILAVVHCPDGEEVFNREHCRDCHSFRGKGGSAGPDLTGVMERRSALWVLNQIRNPGGHNPQSRMPPFRHLSIAEVYSIIRYLNSEGR